MRKKSLFVAFLAGVVASLSAAAPALATPSTLAWGPCPADVASPALQCASIGVPLDYRKPDGRQIQVEISRLASTQPKQRRGVLLFNPGGPGGPGLDFPLEMAQAGLPASVLDSYDLIGFDPRGVGHSTPVTCNFTQFQSNVPPYARDAADVVAHAAEVKQIAQQCGSAKTATLLPHNTTANTARDMDRIRIALGEAKISYYGVSYGTYLGAVYSTLFPQQTDRVVLDSNVGPTGLDVTGSRRFGQGMQDRFPDFAKWAAARNGSYGLGSTPAQVTALYFKLAGQLDQHPLGAVDGAAFRAGTFSLLYSTSQFPQLAQQWQSIVRGQTPAAGPAAAIGADNLLSSQLAVVCDDTAWPRSVETYQHNVAADRARYPMFGAAAANIWTCAFWPNAPVEPQVRIGDRGPSDILMVNNLRDPATPLSGALLTRRALGDRARMVTVDQGGHGVYVATDNACANNTVTQFLVDGVRPARDTQCGAEAATSTPAQQQARDRMLPKIAF